METDRAERIAIAGRELEFVTIPAKNSGLPALVFLHEGLGSVALWRNVPRLLAGLTGCGAIVYSRYGNGYSTPLDQPRTPQYMHDEASIALPAILAELGVDDVVLVGHSDGASIALVYAAEFPGTVRALVLEAPHLFVEELGVRSIAAIRREYETTDLRPRMAAYHADADRTFYGWNDIWLSPEFRNWTIEPYAARVQAPVFAVQGLDDEYGTPAQLDALARLAPAPVDRLLLAGCGHAPHRDRPGLVAAAVAGWLEERGLW